MNQPSQTRQELMPFIFSGGEMGKRIRDFDWSTTPLGPVQTWSPALQSALSICLNSNFPIAIYWGPELILLYNDAWSPIPGSKHPWGLGKPAAQVWPEIWDEVEPQFRKAFTGEPGGSQDALLPMQRHGYTEECYFDFTFTPIVGENGRVEGIFNAVIETTYRILNERRSAFLQRMSFTLADVLSAAELAVRAIGELKSHPKDVAFGMIYSISENEEPVLVGSTLSTGQKGLLKQPWPIGLLQINGQSLYIEEITQYLNALPASHWPEPVSKALMVGLKRTDGTLRGFVVLGISARRGFDKDYQAFLEAIAGVLSSAANTIQSLEEERRRAEALAEIDRAKTTFFSNISHEFRTPLTLLLGPVEEAINDPLTIPENKFRLEVAHRNALRMQKLVNSLLEFSRIEAGRVDGHFVPVDIGHFTSELASTFRSAIEKAGMHLEVEVEPLSQPVYVDIDMWEKIILNLVSNAFKYSKKGTITVLVKPVDERVSISVSDTGIGIPGDQLDKIFERFHRVDNSEGRSQEGTGIGLAMVKELVRLHGGTIQVHSEPGKGSTFSILLPTGRVHLPKEKVIETTFVEFARNETQAYVEEALRWLPPDDKDVMNTEVLPAASNSGAQKPKILLADDNADMRAYGARLLTEHFDVFTATNGDEALEKMLQLKPALLVTDVMMPKLDGFGLLQKVRSHPELRHIPTIFLSARAGEEAKVEGLNAGADDYLVKPFSAKELLVRVTNLVRTNEVRRETEAQFYQLFLQAPAIINVLKGAEMRYEFFHPKNKEIFGDVDFTGQTVREAFPELEGQGIFELLDEVYQTGQTVRQFERKVQFKSKEGKPLDRYLNFTYQPWLNLKGEIQGVLNFAIDVTETVEARKRIEENANNLKNVIEQAPVAMCLLRGPEYIVEFGNERMFEIWGRPRPQLIGRPIFQGLPEAKHQGFEEALDGVYQTGNTFSAFELKVTLPRNGQPQAVYLNFVYEPVRDATGSIYGIVAVAVEVTEQVQARQQIEDVVSQRTAELAKANEALQRTNMELERSNKSLEQFAYAASHDMKEPIRKIHVFTDRLKETFGGQLSQQQMRYFERLEQSTIRMSTLIDDLLSFSQVSMQPMEQEKVDLNTLVQQVLEDMEISIQEKKATVQVGPLPVIKGYPRQLQQVFQNLVSNALKFHQPQKPPIITILSKKADPKDLPNVLSTFGTRIFELIEVRDEGIGFEPGEEDKIFNMFTRLHGNAEYSGTGIGLSIVRKVAENHGGAALASSAPGQGATFQLFIPAS